MPFRAVLKGLLARHPQSVRGAIFCDDEGERVEALFNDPELSAYELDLAGASFASVVHLFGKDAAGTRLRMVNDDGVIWLQIVSRQYYLVLIAARDGRDVTVAPQLDDVSHALVELL